MVDAPIAFAAIWTAISSAPTSKFSIRTKCLARSTTRLTTPAGRRGEAAKLQAEYNSLSQEKALLSQHIREMNGMKQDLASASR